MAESKSKAGNYETLMRAAQAGDARAYARLLKELTGQIQAVVRRQRPFLPKEDIEDLVQEVLVSVHAVRASYDPERPFLPWLNAIVRNRLADGARRYVRQKLHEFDVEQYAVTFSEEATNKRDADYGDPERLRLAIESLPPSQRRALELVKLREMSLSEAAAATGTNVGALKVSVHRGMAALRRLLSKE